MNRNDKLSKTKRTGESGDKVQSVGADSGARKRTETEDGDSSLSERNGGGVFQVSDINFKEGQNKKRISGC